MDIEIIEKNWETYSGILSRLNDENINNLVEALGDRLCLAPANPCNKDWGCYPGGLVVVSTKLAKAMQALNEFHNTPCDIKSVYKIGFLHDIGRLGSLTENWLFEQDSEWHREKMGMEFKPNMELPKLTHLQRTFLFLNHFQVKLSEEEFLALVSLENKEAKNSLGALLLHARNMLEE